MGTVGVRDAGYCIAPDTVRMRRSGRPLTENVRGTARGPLVSGVAAASGKVSARSRTGRGQAKDEQGRAKDGPRADQRRAKARPRRSAGRERMAASRTEWPVRKQPMPFATGSLCMAWNFALTLRPTHRCANKPHF